MCIESDDADFDMSTYAASGETSSIHFWKTEGTIAAPTVVTDNSILGKLEYLGYDGSGYETAASIQVNVDGTPTANGVPGSMRFLTYDDAGTSNEAMFMDSDGNVGVNELDPQDPFHVTNDQDATTSIRIDNSNQGTDIISTSLDFYDGGTHEARIGYNNFEDQLIITNDDLGSSNDDIIINSDRDVRFQTDGVDVMSVDNSRNNVGIGTTTPNAAALLELNSTSMGFVVMRMTAAQAGTITPINGMMLYVTTTSGTFTQIGFWGYENGAWVKL